MSDRWMCSEVRTACDGLPKPQSDDGASVVSATTAETAAEMAVETSDRIMDDGDEFGVWIWKPGDVDNAKLYLVRVSFAPSFYARLSP